MQTVKIKNKTIGLGATPDNCNLSLSVAVTNANTLTGILITQNTAAGVIIGTIYLPASSMIGLVKANTDTLVSSMVDGTVRATPIGFSN